jgi:hypothetical protein
MSLDDDERDQLLTDVLHLHVDAVLRFKRHEHFTDWWARYCFEFERADAIRRLEDEIKEMKESYKWLQESVGDLFTKYFELTKHANSA